MKTGLLAAAIVLALTAAAAGAAPSRSQVADCEHGPVTIGSGPPNWRHKSTAAGPLGVFRHALDQMFETGNGQLTAKMPVIVEGTAVVTLAVPAGQRDRVFLYYGRFLDRDGNPTTQIGRSPGFSEVTFEPCDDKPRTAWPGGIRVKGRAPVTLTVRVEGRDQPLPLRLGRPRLYSPDR